MLFITRYLRVNYAHGTQGAFLQSGFRKGHELNKQIYKEDSRHILHNYEKYLDNYTTESLL
jgi:hypothetical protein